MVSPGPLEYTGLYVSRFYTMYMVKRGKHVVGCEKISELQHPIAHGSKSRAIENGMKTANRKWSAFQCPRSWTKHAAKGLLISVAFFNCFSSTVRTNFGDSPDSLPRSNVQSLEAYSVKSYRTLVAWQAVNQLGWLVAMLRYYQIKLHFNHYWI